MPLRKKIFLVNSGHKIQIFFLEMMLKMCSDFQCEFGGHIIGSFIVNGEGLWTASSWDSKTRLR